MARSKDRSISGERLPDRCLRNRGSNISLIEALGLDESIATMNLPEINTDVFITYVENFIEPRKYLCNQLVVLVRKN